MKNNDISSKVAGSTVGAAAATILLWCLDEFAHVDAGAAVGAALATVLTAAGGWLAKDHARDVGIGSVKPLPVEESNGETPAPEPPAAA